jgi:hypothetical protein
MMTLRLPFDLRVYSKGTEYPCTVMIGKPVYRVKMGKQRLNSAGLKLFDPIRETAPWLFEEPKLIRAPLK